MIPEPIVHLAQIVHLSCIKISTISKWTETTFHLSVVTSEYHRVRPRRLLSLWYIWCQPCTYLSLPLTPSPNRPKLDLTWPSHLGVPSGVSKIISEPLVHLVRTVHLSRTNKTPSPNGPKQDLPWPMSPTSSIGCVQNDFRAYGTFGTNRAPILRQD
jgi:hypothetical protein